METKMIYRFTYVEKSIKGEKWLTHQDLPLEMHKNITEIFLKNNGIDIQEQIEDNVRYVHSDWSSIDGYEKWSCDHKVSAYLELRDTYNKTHSIESHLIGPKEIDE